MAYTSPHVSAHHNNSMDSSAEPPSSSGDPGSSHILTRTVTHRHRNGLTPSQALLRRTLTSSLNKLTTDTFEKVGEAIAQQLQQITTRDDLQFFVDVVVDTAMTKTPTIVSPAEIYADLLLLLKYRCPTINTQSPADPSSDSDTLGEAGALEPLTPDQSGVVVSLTRKLAQEYRDLPSTLNDPVQRISVLESEEGARDKRKRRISGLFLTTGHMFNRSLVDSNLLQDIVFEHLRGSERRPFRQGLPIEEYIEGVCTLLSTTGPYLASKPMGLGFLRDAVDRLRDVRPHITNGKIRSVLDGVLELNDQDKWQPRLPISRTTSDIDVYLPLNEGGLRPGAFADILRRSQSLFLPGPAYAQYLCGQERRWCARQEGIYYEHTSRAPRQITVSFSSPEIERQHVYNPMDPPNVASMSLSRSLSDDEDITVPPRSPTAAGAGLSPVRRPQTPYVRPTRESFETDDDCQCCEEDVHL